MLKKLRNKNMIGMNMFIYLFNEIVREKKRWTDNFEDFEKSLHQLGYNIGYRIVDIELYDQKDRLNSVISDKYDEKKLINTLHFISTELWTNLFGTNTDPLEKSENGSFMIYQSEFIVNKYSTIDCGEFIAGIIHGFLVGTGFKPKQVYSSKSKSKDIKRDVIVIQML